MDLRYKQANKEAITSLLLTIIYLLAWLACAYYLGSDMGVLGLPIWFEVSCIFMPVGFIILCFLVIKAVFKDIPLSYPLENSNNQPTEK